MPGPITSRMSAATAKLLKNGAKLVTNVSDILEELKIEAKGQRLKVREGGSGEEKILLEILKDGSLHIDEIVRRSKMKTGQACSLMTMMEIKGKVRNLGGMVYGVKRELTLD